MVEGGEVWGIMARKKSESGSTRFLVNQIAAKIFLQNVKKSPVDNSHFLFFANLRKMIDIQK